MKKFITLEEAVKILNNNVESLSYEEVELLNAVGRITYEDEFSTINNPPFNKSAMDGYAIIAKDTHRENSKITMLKVVDKVFAGNVCNTIVESNTAVRIMTGAPIPRGANAVVKQEDVIKKGGFITLNKLINDNENICFEGEDIKIGELLVKKGERLNYAYVGTLASCGKRKVKVYKKPKIALISTGDEVIDVNENIMGGKIYNSNKYLLLARLKELNYELLEIKHIKDSAREIAEEIKRLSQDMNLIITTGGASVGEKDLLVDAIDLVKGEKLFWKVLIKPGSAVLCSKINNSLVISLSGNPTAALTTFELLVKTTLNKLCGEIAVEISKEKAVLQDEFTKASKVRRFLRGRVTCDKYGQKVFITQTNTGNGMLSSAINSNCLIDIEAGNNGLFKDQMVNIIKL